MIVMRLRRWCGTREFRRYPKTLEGELNRVLNCLYEGGNVFGSLRPANVTITEAENQLIEFDWAGKAEKLDTHFR